PFNIFALSHPGVDYFTTTIGPYDYWAIEYGYKPIEARTPEEELPELRRIAARCNEPGLAYQSDELADLYDPSIVRYDLGRDPLTYWEEVLAVNRRLIHRLGSRAPARGEDYSEFTRSLYALIQARGDYTRQIIRYVGGLRARRNDRGDRGELPQLVPLTAGEQQRALGLLDTHFFAESEWTIPREYFGHLAADPFALEDAQAEKAFPIRDEVVKIRQKVLRSLFSSERLSRIVNNEYKVARPSETLTLMQLFTSVRQSVWGEFSLLPSVTGVQRELQRAHLDLLISLSDGSTAVPGDAGLLARQQLRELSAKIIAMKGKSQDVYTRLHLKESLNRIKSALAN
ncbi:MAG TPA: zinc-dependent metalloprotease, partial [Pyrinomonadaceae bacterium]|nr:zinc-dependent metalloprotease [Pyrinomonadaceae bacterium]